MDTSDRPESHTWGPPVVVETHSALIFLCGDQAHKVRKPLDLGFLDNRTVAARAEQSRREVELNRRLAPDVYPGVLEVRDEHGDVVDVVVRMRRLPDRLGLDRLVADREPDLAAGVRDVAGQIARLHAASPRSTAIDSVGTPDALADMWAESLEHLRGLSVGEDAPEILDDIASLARAFLRGRGPLLRSRIDAGRMVDGHGDLTAADIYLLPDGPRILDCLEFDDRFRYGDGMLDIGFLAMDLDRLGASDLVVVLLRAYSEASGDTAPSTLIHHYIAYRALVRAKVTAIRAAQLDGRQAISDARTALELADRAVDSLLRGRVRLVLVGGVSGSGKSTLAPGLAGALDAALLSSDVVRGQQGGGGPAGYSDAQIRAVYTELLDRAATLLGQGRTVVLDATWLEPRRRAEAETVAADAHAELVEIVCTAPREELVRRITARAAAGTDPSEATTGVLDAQLADPAPWPEAIEVDTAALDVRETDAVRRWAEQELGPLPWARTGPA